MTCQVSACLCLTTSFASCLWLVSSVVLSSCCPCEFCSCVWGVSYMHIHASMPIHALDVHACMLWMFVHSFSASCVFSVSLDLDVCEFGCVQ